MRRFDPSYAEAKRRVDAGEIGKVVLVRSCTQDPRSTIESTLKFLPHSGGQFLAMKSVDSDQEVQSAKSAIAQLGGRVGKIWDYTIPGTDIRHRVVVIQKQHPTPAAYPRPFARIKKAPLG